MYGHQPKYNLVNVSYWTEPALVLSVYYHLDLLRQNGHYDCIGKYLHLINGHFLESYYYPNIDIKLDDFKDFRKTLAKPFFNNFIFDKMKCLICLLYLEICRFELY